MNRHKYSITNPYSPDKTNLNIPRGATMEQMAEIMAFVENSFDKNGLIIPKHVTLVDVGPKAAFYEFIHHTDKYYYTGYIRIHGRGLDTKIIFDIFDINTNL